MTATEFTNYLNRQAEQHRDTAAYALEQLIADAKEVLDALNEGACNATIGGNVLNQQHFADAERALVRFKDANNAAALAGRIEA